MNTGSAARALMWWMRARGFRLCACTALSEAGQLLQRRFTRTLVDPERTVFGFHGDDLVVEVAAADRTEGALVAHQRVLLHLLAREVPLLGDQLRATELRDLLVPVAVQPL